MTFAHVKNFKYSSLSAYLRYLQVSPTSIHWQSFRGAVRIDDSSRRVLLQLSDIAAGCLGAAITSDKHDAVEYGYLREVQGLIYRRPPGRIETYGLHVIGSPTTLTSQPWWDEFPDK